MAPSPAHRRDTILLALLGAAVFLVLKLNQWHSLGVQPELAEFESRLYSTLHGGFMERHRGEPPFFADHVSPVLLLLLPLYALLPTPLTLLVVQALAAAAAVVPLHRLALHLLERRAAAAALGLAYLVSRTLDYGLMYDFHMEIFYPLMFFGAFLAFERRRWGWLAAAAILAAMCKEDAGLALAGLGAYVFARGARRAGALLATGGLAWLIAAVTLVSPAFRHGAGGSEYPFVFYWSGYGHTQAEVLRGMLNPLTHVRVLFAHPKPGQMFDLFAGYAFLPFVDPAAALFLVLPGWFVLYSSDNPMMNGPILYYGLLILPFLFYATMLGIRRLGWSLGPATRARWTVALAGVVLLIQLGNSRLFQQLSPGAFRQHGRTAAARALIARIPRDAQVSAQAGLVSYVPAANERFALPDGLEHSAWALFDTVGVQRSLGPERNRALLARLEDSGAWEREAAASGFVLLRRRAEEAPVAPPARPLRD
jgi:uncharacterized membrane protein